MPQRYLFRVRMIACLILLGASSPPFASPALNSFMQRVWQNNPSIQAFESALQASKSRKLAADQPIYNPEVGVDLERTDVNTLSIGINQTIDWGNKRFASTGKADAEIQLAQAELSKQRLAVAKDVLNTLVNLRSTANLQDLARQRVKLMLEFVENTEKRQQAGDIGLQDVALARVALSEAKMQFASSASQQAKYEAQLQATTEIFVTEWPMLAYEPPSPVTLSSSTLKNDEYLSQLPSLIALKAQLSAAKSNIGLSKAKRKADPSFGLRGGTESGDTLVGLSFSMPLFVRNSYRAEVEVANQESLQIEQFLLSATRRAQAHLNGSHRRYQLTYDAWQSWKQTGLSSLNEQFNLIQSLWKSGEMNTSDYLIQAKQNVDAQETAVELASQMWEAWIERLVASAQIEQWINQTK